MSTTSEVLNAAPKQKGVPAADALKAAVPPSQGTTDGKSNGLTEKIRRDAATLRNALAFTQVVGVLMRSPQYQRYTLADLEWLVIPPLMAGQFRIGEAKPDNRQGPTLPVAVVLWAMVSPEIDKRLLEGSGAALRLKPEEWKSGEIPWLLHAAGETRFVRFVVDQLVKTTLKGRPVKVCGRDREGNVRVHVLDGAG